MMKGIIDYITGPSLNAKILRDNFVFKLLPMLNPDGVINGSSRCNLAGVDLNRVWIDPNRKLHPTVFHMKNVSRWLDNPCADDQEILRRP
jgi:murein tripeptide amidase MpaA